MEYCSLDEAWGNSYIPDRIKNTTDTQINNSIGVPNDALTHYIRDQQRIEGFSGGSERVNVYDRYDSHKDKNCSEKYGYIPHHDTSGKYQTHIENAKEDEQDKLCLHPIYLVKRVINKQLRPFYDSLELTGDEKDLLLLFLYIVLIICCVILTKSMSS